ALGVLRDITALLDARDVTHHVCDGTLLGIVRENGFIAGDGDIDFRVDRNALIPELENVLEEGGFTIFKRSYTEGRVANIGLARGGILVDFYGTEFARGQSTYELIFKHAYLSYRVPFDGRERVDFRGVQLWLPKRAGAELRFCYGPDWHKPAQGWDDLFSHGGVFRCVGKLRYLYAAALRFQRARMQAQMTRPDHAKAASPTIRMAHRLRALSWIRLG
ncbi:MAG: hypothetical protein OQK00_07865, partial [Rhodobacteraceae bacterium]|nr:hypothetical protein [Paracoccaceae bacterium]